jgi:uncharacterized membrane protein
MRTNNLTLQRLNSLALISSAISFVLLTSSTASYAAGHEKQAALEKCGGIVKAGLNDCASAEHACAGLNTDDGYDNDWLWLPEGTCKKIKTGQIVGDNS